MSNGPAKPRSSKIHQQLLNTLKRGDTILTFNYDTVIEESMPESDSLWAPKGGYGVQVTGLTLDWAKRWLRDHQVERSQEAEIDLLKLHGSLNWGQYKTSTAAVRLKPRPYVIRMGRYMPVSERALFLPPGWHKRVDRNPYNTIWQQARLKLDKCATLMIVGYSLPETDLIARALFAEVTRVRRARGKYLKELHVADVSAEARDRIVGLFLPALGHTGIIYRYSDAKELSDSMVRHAL